MTKLRSALAALGKRLGVQTALRTRAVRRMTARHLDQQKFEHQQEKAENQAETLRNEATRYLIFGPDEDQAKGERKMRKAHRLEAKAQRLAAKAEKQKRKAIVYRGVARRKTQQIHGIKTDLGKVESQIAALGPQVDLGANKVTGGTFKERWVKACLTAIECCSNGRRRNAYNEWRPADIDHPFGPGPSSSDGDDCSSFGISICKATGADDPAGFDFNAAGSTATMVEAHGRWKEVSIGEMKAAGQGFIIYGSGGGFHTEMFTPLPGQPELTTGHGTAAVDHATIHAFGAGMTERYYIFVE